MADLNINTVAGGLEIISDTSKFVLNEFSIKRNNLNVDSISIVSDIKDNYAEFEIVFSNWDNIFFNTDLVADIDSLYTLVQSIPNYTSTAAIDSTTNSTKSISFEHNEIHEGHHYNYCDYALAQTNGTEIEFVITTPDTTTWVHFVFEVSSSDGCTVELYEGTTGVVGGTSIIPRNNNRNSANSSVATIVKDPISIAGDGIRASGLLSGGSRQSGIAARDRENVLKRNESYLVRITSLANGNDIAWCGQWYEHINS